MPTSLGGGGGQVRWSVSSDFADGHANAEEHAKNPARIGTMRREVMRVLEWRLSVGVLTGDDFGALFVSNYLRQMQPLKLRSLKGKPKIDSRQGARSTRSSPSMIEIQTSYTATGPQAGLHALTAPSAYGRGTTAMDRAAGNTSLRFHGSRQGEDHLFLRRAQPFPTYAGGRERSSLPAPPIRRR